MMGYIVHRIILSPYGCFLSVFLHCLESKAVQYDLWKFALSWSADKEKVLYKKLIFINIAG